MNKRWHLFWLRFGVLAQVFMVAPLIAGPLFDTSTPISFFTNVASRLLSSELNLKLGQLQVYPTNQYTPAAHRLLQVTANILDAQNTNFYPTVFRPLFAADASSNIFIIGYQQVTNVSGAADPQLAPPHDVTELQNFPGNTAPIADGNGPVNVYGVPWVIGAKQGLPNFNQFSTVSAVQVTRQLEVARTSLNTTTATYSTNQTYIIGISNSLGVTFWNSYSNTYYPHSGSLTVFTEDYSTMLLTNGIYQWAAPNLYVNTFVTNSWPGSRWTGTPPNAIDQDASMIANNWSYLFQSPLPYDFRTARFDAANLWQPTSPGLPQLPQFGLLLTNYLQTFILDGGNVIDYVQICSPIVSGNLNQALADPDYPDGKNIHYQWSTNSFQSTPPTPSGVINQLAVSQNPSLAPAGAWITSPTPMGIVTPQAEAAFFKGFFASTFQFAGLTYVNREIDMLAPYTPSRTVYVSFLLQANDPLMHYLASDLNSLSGALALWSGKRQFTNGLWSHSDDLVANPLPIPPLSPIGGRYQPWGRAGQMAALATLDTNAYNLAYKDPLVWDSDYWNFPTGQAWNLSWLGQVHRGTPWQTIYLKSTNILSYAQSLGDQDWLSAGSNTWAAWTADLQPDPQSGQYLDAANSAPVKDWQLVSLLATMLNTNDLREQFPVNNPDPNAWSAQLNGMTALTNTLPAAYPYLPPQFNPVIISSNSAQASIVVNAIESIKAAQPNQIFQGVGDILATPQLTIQSPYLNLSPNSQLKYGISEQAYEAIPSQLLPLLRADAVGKMVSTNGQIQAQFSGGDGHTYAIQVSPDLLNWTSLSTNSPVNGVINATIPTLGNTASQFYRSVLIQ